MTMELSASPQPIRLFPDASQVPCRGEQTKLDGANGGDHQSAVIHDDRDQGRKRGTPSLTLTVTGRLVPEPAPADWAAAVLQCRIPPKGDVMTNSHPGTVSTVALPSPASWERGADIVVIGSGAAGLPAAIWAREAGASVILVEAEP